MPPTWPIRPRKPLKRLNNIVLGHSRRHGWTRIEISFRVGLFTLIFIHSRSVSCQNLQKNKPEHHVRVVSDHPHVLVSDHPHVLVMSDHLHVLVPHQHIQVGDHPRGCCPTDPLL